MNRRSAVLFLAAMPPATILRRVHAQARMRRVAMVGIGDSTRPPYSALIDGLRELGHVEGSSFELLRSVAGDDPDGRARARLAAAAVERKVDVIVAWGVPAVAAVRKVSTKIPVVMVLGSDPVEAGVVRNLARPEGNITGIATGSSLLVQKRMELLKELVPGVRRVGVLNDPSAGSRPQVQKHLSQAADRLGLQVHLIDVTDPTATREVAAALSSRKPDALFIVPSNRFLEYRNEIVQVAAALRLPATYSTNGFVRAGGLVAYSADGNALYRRAAYFVDRLLKGATPADLPVEQPTNFILALNLRTARTLGLSIPHGVLVRADEVIQ